MWENVNFVKKGIDRINKEWYNKYIIKKERGAWIMATVFEIERTTGTVYGIRTVNGNCLWFNDRDSRDKRFLEMQN